MHFPMDNGQAFNTIIYMDDIIIDKPIHSKEVAYFGY